MGKINIVLEGKYKELKISGYQELYVQTPEYVGGRYLNKKQISSYIVLDENSKNSSEYSFWKGALGVALFGGIGAIAGVKGKSKKEYLIAIEWKDGERSLICVDEEYYKVFVKSMF